MSKIIQLKYKLHKSKFTSKAYNGMHRVKVKIRKSLPDKEFAEQYYKEKTGKRLNIENPITFDEKQWWIKLYYKDPLMTQCADKYLVREYIKKCGLENILNELYFVYNNPNDISLNELPNKFFLKTNHGCGYNYLCNNKNRFPLEKVKKELKRALAQNYYYESREWPYKNITPLVLAEKVIVPSENEPLADYRFLCFGGKCHFVFIDLDTCDNYGKHNLDAVRNVYDPNGNILNIKASRNNYNPDRVSIPNNFKEMVMCAEKLSKPFPFVRVDLYNIQNKIIFGELTFFHAGGVTIFEPDKYQKVFGDLIKLPK